MTNETLHKDFDPEFFELLFEVEDKHFWFRSRNRIIAALVKRLTSELTDFLMLEVGCGTGNVLRMLNQACPNGTVVGMDLFAEGLKYARLRTSAALVQGNLHQPPFNNQFEIIGLFDVLEHLTDDRQVLSDLKVMLRKDGILLLTVPAHRKLWSYFDEASHHCRRYQPFELKRKLMETGYDVEYITQYMMSIFPLVWLGRRLTSLSRSVSRQRIDTCPAELATQELRPIPIVNEVLTWLLDIERRWLACGHSLPFGTSLLAVARKSR